jgi:hypothetical protein
MQMQQAVTTTTTPVFNNICGVPNVGDESNFVRIRQDVNNEGDENISDNSSYTIGTLDNACTTGTTFDLWNYLHNNAETQYNDNGSGSAVAHDVQSLLKADGIGTTASNFNFSDTVSASNAASVSDSVMLNCDGNNVALSLVPGSVHIYYQSSDSWVNLADSTVNGPNSNTAVKLGSPTPGNGDMWGCWNYRMVVVYQVEVTKPTPPPTAVYACDELDVAAESDRTVKISTFNTTASKGVTFNNAVIDWGDNSAKLTTANVVGQTYQYAANGTYKVSVIANFTVNGQTESAGGVNCEKQVTFSSTTPPTTTPPTIITTTSTPAAPTSLVNTGAGSVVGIFAATTALGAAGYRWMTSRRLSRQ